jgi:hypothetical protein
MTFGKLSSLTRTASILSLLAVAAILFVASLVTGPQIAATTTAATLTPEEEDVEETQETAIENLTEEDRDVNGIEFTPRWGAISTIEPGSIDVLFADCLEDEFAVSSQFVFETSDVIASQSFPVAFPDDDDETAMTWVAVIENTHNSDDKAASIGVICAGENDDDDDDDDRDINISTKTTINNIVKNFIRVENNQIVNLNNVINIRQEIVQNAYQILSITGNNNTVNQVINQAATQIANVNATTPTEIQQIIDQNAQQEGVISGTGNQTSLSQLIEQDAAQQANVTEGEEPDTTDIDQAIDQEAEQAANVTEGEEPDTTDIDQAIDQEAEQAANVTEGEEPDTTDIDQAIDQEAEQAANVTGTSIEQLIQERAQQQAQVDEQEQQLGIPDTTDIEQAIGQNASQQAQLGVEEVPGNSTGG